MELVIYQPTEDQFLQSIDFNYEDLKAELEAGLKKYEGLVYSETNIKEAKSDRANLNKFKEAIETRRKEIKKACLKPYEDFEVKIKDLVAMVDKPILAIDTQVKSYEQAKKDQKLAQIEEFAAIHVGDLWQLVPFKRLFNDKWLNATYKMADIEKEITELFARVTADLKVITGLQSDYELQIKDTYLKNYDLTQALQEKTRLEEQAAKLAEYKRQQEEAKKQQEHEEKPVVHQAETVTWPTPTPPKEIEQKIDFVDFRVWGTLSELTALKQFLKDNNYKYGPVPGQERKVG